MMREETMSALVNPEVLRWARERLRLTPEEVEQEAQKLTRRYYEMVTAEEVRSWEEGRGEPSMGQLETLGKIYICQWAISSWIASLKSVCLFPSDGFRREKRDNFLL